MGDQGDVRPVGEPGHGDLDVRRSVLVVHPGGPEADRAGQDRAVGGPDHPDGQRVPRRLAEQPDAIKPSAQVATS